MEPRGTILPVQSEFGIVCDERQRNLDPACRLSECVSSFADSVAPPYCTRPQSSVPDKGEFHATALRSPFHPWLFTSQSGSFTFHEITKLRLWLRWVSRHSLEVFLFPSVWAPWHDSPCLCAHEFCACPHQEHSCQLACFFFFFAPASHRATTPPNVPTWTRGASTSLANEVASNASFTFYVLRRFTSFYFVLRRFTSFYGSTWYVVRGTWHGARCTVYGARCTVYGVRLTFDVWRLTFDVWRLTFDVWRLTFDVWRLTFDVWRLTFDVWRLTLNVKR